MSVPSTPQTRTPCATPSSPCSRRTSTRPSNTGRRLALRFRKPHEFCKIIPSVRFFFNRLSTGLHFVGLSLWFIFGWSINGAELWSFKHAAVRAAHLFNRTVRFTTLIFKPSSSAQECTELFPTSEINAVRSLTFFFDALATPENGLQVSDTENYVLHISMLWTFALTWSLGASVTEDSRRKFDMFVREVQPPPHRLCGRCTGRWSILCTVKRMELLCVVFVLLCFSHNWKTQSFFAISHGTGGPAVPQQRHSV